MARSVYLFCALAVAVDFDDVPSMMCCPHLKAHAATMVMPDNERRYVGGASTTLNEKMRERLWSRVNAKAKPLQGVKVKPGTQWLKPGLVGRVRLLKGEQLLRHATLRENREEN